MGFRITTWNVNGIRNPFSYEPWRGTRTFEYMFDTLEADIVVLQETKIQRKDLRDDMVLVPGWDCYSGVVIYTRNATCSPIRAEEGITGVLCSPKSAVSFRDLPKEQQIGGYPTDDQLSRPTAGSEGLDSEEEQDNVGSNSDTITDAATIDSEGRCVILEFPAFVLIGVYCPANRDESRDNFRMGFLNALDSRVRNLTAMGKRVVVTGDINIAKQAIDAAHGIEAIRKGIMTEEGFISRPSRRLFNHLISDGEVVGERDEGREEAVLFDICRAFHPGRTGMYTCWDQKLNSRPGNYGARIDYVLCSLDMQDWFSDANIQEGLMGSDHCPVYAVIKETVNQAGGEVNIRDIVNPPGMFKCGERQQDRSAEWALPASGRLLPEFDVDKRRSIKDMFTRKSMSAPSQSESVKPAISEASTPTAEATASMVMTTPFGSNDSPKQASASTSERDQLTQSSSRKRSRPLTTMSAKRSKSAILPSPGDSASGQKTLTGFFKPKTLNSSQVDEKAQDASSQSQSTPRENTGTTELPTEEVPLDNDTVVDPIVSKEDWSKLFTKKSAPLCEGHQEPCISLTTKKPGMNCGRLFWICPRPLGPSGEKEQGTQWRCPTFIWASDWKSPGATHAR
ncbi:Endonuclease/exonuclease/phosphatase [Penicillium bovifimosum]|uniref:DNA-(apurinic or apyrimidinic site) endonuclease 2 n=1 Tax=Penicillium bovifimosum TaxID=126998 RepID=A0A9W9GN58_9EURO|nr:Endonuclease/exonuclease/phosphatase [Penicillium bovifimosum]KAJ5124715.1 Endonuclease/exonuclease/phosphatase [Penicillium bovifimosum]